MNQPEDQEEQLDPEMVEQYGCWNSGEEAQVFLRLGTWNARGGVNKLSRIIFYAEALQLHVLCVQEGNFPLQSERSINGAFCRQKSRLRVVISPPSKQTATGNFILFDVGVVGIRKLAWGPLQDYFDDVLLVRVQLPACDPFI